MKLLQQIDSWLISWGVDATWANYWDQWIAFLLVIVMAISADYVCRTVLLRVVARLVKHTKVEWDDILFDHRVMKKLGRIVMPCVLYVLVPVAFDNADSWGLTVLLRICYIYILYAFINFINAFLKAVYTVYSTKEELKDRPLKGLLQIFQIALWMIGGIIAISKLMGESPFTLLAGLGASAAVLMLIFKDSIMGFVSGVQLSANDMLRVGDWITMPKYGADGTVIEVTLNTVKVRNFDYTIVTIPPYLLVSDSFQNWRGMRESGGRRVKRSICIDMTSIKFCTSQMLDKYRKIQLLTTYIDQTEAVVTAYNEEHNIDNSVLVNGHRQTNLGVLRAYLTAYLKSLPTVNSELNCMVRQLQPTDHGLPIELYFFSNVKDWIPYEEIQSDIFDHVLAIIPEFGLRVFQSPSGTDFQQLSRI